MTISAVQTPLALAARTHALCQHCGLGLPPGSASEYCCSGCEAVAALLVAEGLGKFYDLAPAQTTPVGAVPRAGDATWVDAIEPTYIDAERDLVRYHIDIQGLRCAACVWLIERLFERQPEAGRMVVNPSLGTVEIDCGTGFSLARFVGEVERFGYLLGPARKGASPVTSDLLIRMGVCIALAGNTMLLASASYFGLEDGPLSSLFALAMWAMTALSVVVGGPVFFRSAIEGMRHRVLHLDLPISVGIVLAFAGSSWAFWSGRLDAIYFDSVSVFIALMLVGRVVQERVVSANRSRLLADSGARSVLCRKVQGGRVTTEPATSVAVGDELLCAVGDVVPVAGTLLGGQPATVTLGWIDGESEPRMVEPGQTVMAGAIVSGASAIRLLASETFDASTLARLLTSPGRSGDGYGVYGTRLSRRVSGLYVAAVLLVAAAGMATWFALGHGARAVEVATAILVVTCPCAFGLALPLAHELALVDLRRHGLFVRTSDFLDRVGAIDRVVFDKTGTLTSGTSHVRDGKVLEDLAAADRAALYDLAARSGHPRSQAIRAALAEAGETLSDDVEVCEVPGHGIGATIAGHRYRLGQPGWVAGGAPSTDGAGREVAFAKDDQILAHIELEEQLRPDAAIDVAGIRQAGYQVDILSGDIAPRAVQVGARLGLPADACHGGLTPEAKADWLRKHGGNSSLYVGDGINDSLAIAEAHVAGTPAVDRPFIAARSDFYLTSVGLGPVRRALWVARRLLRTSRLSLGFALLYNVGAVALALAGLMQPWTAAILMPASSIAVILFTVWSLSGRRMEAAA